MTPFSDPCPSNVIVSAGLLTVTPLKVACPCWTGEEELLAETAANDRNGSRAAATATAIAVAADGRTGERRRIDRVVIFCFLSGCPG